MDSFGCSRTTKYLARSYISFYVNSRVSIAQERLQLLGMTAILLAIKVFISVTQFNESVNYPL
jgi:hypothetical protein